MYSITLVRELDSCTPPLPQPSRSLFAVSFIKEGAWVCVCVNRRVIFDPSVCCS